MAVSSDALEIVFPPGLGEARATARAELLADALGRALGRTVTVVVAPSYDELERRILAGVVDVAWTPPALCARTAVGARFVLPVLRSGGSTYRGAVLARAESARLRDATRLRAAWVHPQSTAGCLLPRAWLRDHGYTRIEESFHGNYRDAVHAVVGKHADICSVYVVQPVDEAVHRTLRELVGSVGERLLTLGFTRESPSDALIVTRRPPESVAVALAALLAGPAAKPPPALLDVCNATGFAVGAADDYADLR